MLLILSVATEINTGVKLFIESMKHFNYEYKILGFGKKWNGGDMEKGPGGGQKINLLKEELRTWDIYKKKNTTILFTDSYDVIFLSNVNDLLKKYSKFDKDSVLFSSEKSCWPNEDLKTKYPDSSSPYKYLNSGGFIGLANNIDSIINDVPINDYDDDQLYFTNIFLSNKYKIKIDYNCEIFQTMNKAIKDIHVDYFNRNVVNKFHKTLPCVLHANGPNKEFLFSNFECFFTDMYIFDIK